MVICWQFKVGFNIDVRKGMLSLHYVFFIGTCNLNYEIPCYIPCIECIHMPFQFFFLRL